MFASAEYHMLNTLFFNDWFFQTLTEALLCSDVSENIQFAGELLETRVDRSPVNNPYLQQLPFAQAVKLVITAATHYCNSSENYTDKAMDLAL